MPIYILTYLIMSRRAVFNEQGMFMGYQYVSHKDKFYAPVRGVSDTELSSYCASRGL